MNSSETFADRAFEEISRLFAAGSTRRSWLGRTSRIVFGLIGFEFLSAMPVRAQNAVATTPEKCGAYGNLCGSDCRLNDFTCPSNCKQGGFWRACCPVPNNGDLYFDYYDCFLQSGKKPPCPTQTMGSKAAKCQRALKEIYRDSVTGTYCCSVISGTGVPCTDP